MYQSLTVKCKLVLSFVYPLTLVTFASCLYIGQVLTYEDIQEVIKFCACEKLVLFADEVLPRQRVRGGSPVSLLVQKSPQGPGRRV